MQTRQIQMNDVIYNAAEQCFEALVTVHDGDRSRKYACAINAPMTMSFDQAAKGLTTQAECRQPSRPSRRLIYSFGGTACAPVPARVPPNPETTACLHVSDTRPDSDCAARAFFFARSLFS